MRTFSFTVRQQRLLADTVTPVQLYLKVRDRYPQSLLLESSDYHAKDNSVSFICLDPMATFSVSNDQVTETLPDGEVLTRTVAEAGKIPGQMQRFFKKMEVRSESEDANGFFGYFAYNAVRYFDKIDIGPMDEDTAIPDVHYSFYRYIIAIHHFHNELVILENIPQGDISRIAEVEAIVASRNYPAFSFTPGNNEKSNLTDDAYKKLVRKGREHCFRGDVFQVVLSRQYSQEFLGDEFNVYRALRSVNPSPYLFYFDYGNFRLFGSSPEAQMIIEGDKAIIHPIAGTFKRTGDDVRDKELAEALVTDHKENAEHVMLVDLARNDLSRNSDRVVVENFREVQYFSHVLHLVSKVAGRLNPDTNPVRVLADSFPAGTLSGAPKHRAMQLIEQYEQTSRGFYGGCIGFIGLNGDVNQAITIRSFLSKNNRLYYQAGAGIVSESNEQKELEEVNNKLQALKSAIALAATL